MNVTKRYLIAAAAHNLGRILRRLTGVGKPRALQGAAGGLSGLPPHLLARRRIAPMRFADVIARMVTALRPFAIQSETRLARSCLGKLAYFNGLLGASHPTRRPHRDGHRGWRMRISRPPITAVLSVSTLTTFWSPKVIAVWIRSITPSQ